MRGAAAAGKNGTSCPSGGTSTSCASQDVPACDGQEALVRGAAAAGKDGTSCPSGGTRPSLAVARGRGGEQNCPPMD